MEDEKNLIENYRFFVRFKSFTVRIMTFLVVKFVDWINHKINLICLVMSINIITISIVAGNFYFIQRSLMKWQNFSNSTFACIHHIDNELFNISKLCWQMFWWIISIVCGSFRMYFTRTIRCNWVFTQISIGSFCCWLLCLFFCWTISFTNIPTSINFYFYL